MIGNPGKDEEKIRESVDVDEQLPFDITERHHRALGAPADGSGDVQGGAGRRAAWQNEAAQRRKLQLQRVDPALEALDVVGRNRRLGDPPGNLAGRIGKAGSERKEIALQLFQDRSEWQRPAGFFSQCRAREAEPRIQLVDVTVGRDPRIGLRDPRAVEQAGLASVTGPGVDFHRTIIELRRNASLMPTRVASDFSQLPVPARRQWFRRRLLAWYRANGRDLPWRRTSDPYHILVSEVMLQQTQVDRVLPKYEEWLTKYPSLRALAEAPVQDVAETWRPLGYNIRPRRLHDIARESVTRYGGQLPSDEETLLSFKGIGEYTAGAVLSFAFGQRKAILDTNVARVLFRVFVGKGDPRSHGMKRHLWSVSRTVLPARHVFDFNQALMDFGATLCSARKPACGDCPLRGGCASYPFDPSARQRTRARPASRA